MNREHLELCASAEWREALRDLVLPYALAGARLGDDVLEIGPGPGLTTDLLRSEVVRLTAVELDDQLASALTAHLAGTNVEVVNADATELPFGDGRFTGAVSLTMLHHVPTAELQDRLFAEVARVLRPEASSSFPTALPLTTSPPSTTTTSTTPSIPTPLPTGSRPRVSPTSRSVPMPSAGPPGARAPGPQSAGRDHPTPRACSDLQPA